LLPATQQLTKTPPHTVGFLRFRSPISERHQLCGTR